jgi:8-amino-7-oxononanoate synthase
LPLAAFTLKQMSRKRLYEEVDRELAELERRSLRREVVRATGSRRIIERDGQPLLNLAGNDYLGLSQHPRVTAAAAEAAKQDGVGAGASKLIAGHLGRHVEAERKFAELKHAEAALLLSTGYMANLAAVTALARPGDLICLDKLNHASLIDAARLSGAEVRTFPHRGYDKLARLLQRGPRGRADEGGGGSDAADRGPRCVVVTDSIFSMDGDVADLPRLATLTREHEALLVVDEAHATGVLGRRGAGLAEWQGVTEGVDVTVSTASKGLGGLGGVVTAARPIVNLLKNRARPLIYTTGAPPAQAAAISAALDVVAEEPWRRGRLAELARRLRQRVSEGGWPVPGQGGEDAGPAEPVTPILPVVVGEAERALGLARHLRERGIFAGAVRYPTVGPGAARVRLSLRADLTDADVAQVEAALAEAGRGR